MKKEVLIRKVLAILPVALFLMLIAALYWTLISSRSIGEMIRRDVNIGAPLIFLIRVTLTLNVLMCTKALVDKVRKRKTILAMSSLVVLLVICITATVIMFSHNLFEFLLYFSPLFMSSDSFSITSQRMLPFILSFVIAILGYWEAHQTGKHELSDEKKIGYLKQRKTSIDIGYLLCAFSLLSMGMLSMLAQGTDVFSREHMLNLTAPRTFMLLGSLPLLVSIVFSAGVIIATIKDRTRAHIIASLLTLPYLGTSFFTLVMVGYIHIQAGIFSAMQGWSPMRDANSFLVRNFVMLQVMFIFANAILMYIPVKKKGVKYKIIIGMVSALYMVNLFIILDIDNIFALLVGMSSSIIYGANYFGINNMAVILPIGTGIALACGSISKSQTKEAPLEEAQQVDEHVGSEEISKSTID